jgi:hypothetical protein
MFSPQFLNARTNRHRSSAGTRTGFDNQPYELIFSDKFEFENRTFYAGDDLFRETVDISYGVTNDLEWYDPKQIMTKKG